MKILIMGSNGYIGSRLLPILAKQGHTCIAMIRSEQKLVLCQDLQKHVEIVVADCLDRESLDKLPHDIDIAYYLIHSMTSKENFFDLEQKCATNFVTWVETTPCQQIVYLSGLAETPSPSIHMSSRHNVEYFLHQGSIPVTTLRAGITIGSGSASFEILRDLVEKLPLMITPKWVRNRSQPIAIRDVLFYLTHIIGLPQAYGRVFEIAGPDVLTYQEMMQQLAKQRGLKRYILHVPVLTPRLSSYWLYFVTSTNLRLARALVESLKIESVCRDFSIDEILPHSCLTFEESIHRAFAPIEQNEVVSGWEEVVSIPHQDPKIWQHLEVPKFGAVSELIEEDFTEPREVVLDRLWSIGGTKGWYQMNWAWKLRGWMDRCLGGVGLRRGRKDPAKLESGDTLDFWRVIVADRKRGHLLLYAEMKLPGEGWLDFRVTEGAVIQTATFRPKGLLGRLYWYSLFPIHHFIFRKLCKAIVGKIPITSLEK